VIDNIMIDISRINSFHVPSINNALSDHDAQYLVLNDVFTKSRGANTLHRCRFFILMQFIIFDRSQL
jgi:hypothetical protein